MSNLFNGKEEFSDKNVEEIMEKQRPAVEAHGKLYSSFKWDDGYVYPSDFSGDYIDEYELHIKVTNKEAIEKYQDLLSDCKNFVFEIAEYSYGELLSNVKKHVNILKKNYDIVSYGVNVRSNRGTISIISSDYDKLTNEKYIKELNDNNIIIISEARHPILNTSTIIAGSKIYTDTCEFTLGGSGSYDGKTAFVTCGHGLKVDDIIKYNNSEIGKVIINQFVNAQYGDYSIIEADPEYAATAKVFYGDGLVTNFDGWYDIPDGAEVYKYGAYGNESRLTVIATDQTVTLDNDGNDIEIKGLSIAKIEDGRSEDGDSGGPYRADHKICGIHSAYAEDTKCTYFTPFKFLVNEGFNIETNNQ